MNSIDNRAVMDRAVAHLVTQYSPKGRYIGWVMLASILVEAWDLYSIGFVLVFMRESFHPSAALLGLAAAGTQGGAVIGALAGGWLADKIGRRAIFLSTMVMFIVFALAQAFVPNIGWLIIIRFILGIPLGSDISNGYTYISAAISQMDTPISWRSCQKEKGKLSETGGNLCSPWAAFLPLFSSSCFSLPTFLTT